MTEPVGEGAPRVMVVEDDEGHVALIRRALRGHPYDVRFVSTLAEAEAQRAEVQLVVVDWRLPDGHGTDLLADDHRPLPVVIMTSHGDEHVAVEAMKKGALDYVVKSDAMLTEFDRVIERSLRAWRNIDQRHQAELALSTSEARWRSMVESSPDVILLTDPEGRVVFNNRELHGAETSAVGQPLARVFGADARPALEAAMDRLRRGETVESFTVQLGANESGQHYELRLAPVAAPEGGLVVSASNITSRHQAERERVALEQQLQQAQRLETIGTLAGGVAHDFNNILQAILGFTQLAMSGFDETPATRGVRRDLQSVVDAAQRGRELVMQILAFSRHQAQELRPVRAVDVVDEALRLVRVSAPLGVEIDVEHDDPELRLQADTTQLHQVIVNLCTNAVQAMTTGGRLTVRTDVGPVPDETRASHELVEGDYARIRIEDSGSGMDAATLDRIFEPFFTTKPSGSGTGLGLAVVHGIVRGHGGAIRVESELGRGTAFTVYLPRLAPKKASRPSLPQVGGGSGEHVLFVDDEPMVVRVAQEMLARFGYRVTTFRSPVDALTHFKADPSAFDAVVTDLSMPAMNGVDFAAELHATRSDVPILLTTGYAARVKAGGNGVRRVLVKPYDIQQLSSALREVLSE